MKFLNRPKTLNEVALRILNGCDAGMKSRIQQNKHFDHSATARAIARVASASLRKAFFRWVGTCCVRSATLGASLMMAKAQAQDFTYTNLGGAIAITGSTPRGGLMGTLDVPSAINGLPVVSIGAGAFVTNGGLTRLIIPSSVTNIGSGAFLQCGFLTNVTMSEGLMAIEDGAFAYMFSLPNLTIPNSVTSMGISAFFNSAHLTNVVIGNGVTNIGDHAFNLCYTLASVYFKGDAPVVGSSSFVTSTNTTVYFLPGTKGWGATFGGAPTKLWNPQGLANDAGFGARRNRFGFNIAGTSGIPLVVEACTNLATSSWVPLQGCTLTNGLVYFSDPQWTNFSGRFYRIRSP